MRPGNDRVNLLAGIIQLTLTLLVLDFYCRWLTGGKYLSFVCPKERYQRKGRPKARPLARIPSVFGLNGARRKLAHLVHSNNVSQFPVHPSTPRHRLTGLYIARTGEPASGNFSILDSNGFLTISYGLIWMGVPTSTASHISSIS